MNKILIVDDNETLLFALSGILEDEGWQYSTAKNGTQAVEEVRKSEFSLVILDYKLPDIDGVEVLSRIKKLKPALPVIMLTAFGDIKRAVESVKKGAENYLTKPFDNQELIITIKKVLNEQITKDELNLLREKFNKSYAGTDITLLGQSMSEVLNHVKLVAPTNMSILLQGESGSGKEVIANIIHKMSGRSKEPFVAVDCGAIPETLFESEMFGYEKGAFTDAKNAKQGKFELANKGTLFLDEILNLSEASQAKLLRVLEDRKVTRLGGNSPMAVDVRILSASNVILTEAVTAKSFRADLFYRLNEFQINIPPLRDRKGDIPELVSQFIKDANGEINRNASEIDQIALSKLMEYTWPGNVRELRNVIRRAVLLCKDNTIKPIDFSFTSLNLSSNNLSSPQGSWAGTPITSSSSETSFGTSAHNAEREIILHALTQNNGNKTRTAKQLKMNLRTLYRKLESLNIK